MAKKLVGRPKRASSVEPIETRARIIEVAEHLLVERGYAGVSMDAVAKQVGITKATIYHHFPDGKDEVIKAVADEMLERYKEGVSQAIDSTPVPREQLRAIAACIVSGYGQAERMMRESAAFLPNAYVEELSQKAVDNIHLPIENVLKAGIETGDFRPHDTKFVRSALFSLLLISQNRAHRHLAPSEFTHLILDFVINGIGGCRSATTTEGAGAPE